jgi:hypothetical protein
MDILRRPKAKRMLRGREEERKVEEIFGED